MALEDHNCIDGLDGSPMLVDESVAIWATGIKQGDPDAVQRLWEQYFSRLVGIARRILRSTPKRWKDEEDVALSAFKSFYCRAIRIRK